MQRLTLQVGTFDVNCSILHEDDKAWIVDPGHEADRIAAELARLKLAPQAILLTHAHFDHIGAVPELQQRFPGLPVCVHMSDVPAFMHPMNQMPPDYPRVGKPSDIHGFDDGLLPPGFRAIETPGHTPGGVCYYSAADKLLLAGDTLFAGSVGRTDLPGGDMATLMDSLKKLIALPDDTRVIPGHGPETTIAAEKSGNPFLQ